MNKKNIMSLVSAFLALPMSAQAASISSTPLIGWVFIGIAPLMTMNKLSSLLGVIIFLLSILLEALVVSRVAHVVYKSCAKRMIVARIVSCLANMLVILIGLGIALFSNFELYFGKDGMFQGGAPLSLEQKMLLGSKFTWMLLSLVLVVFSVKMLVEYIAFRRFGISVERKTLIKAVLLANAASYGIMLVIVLIMDHFKIALSSL
ncbi:MAG: hypothetical protein NTU89_00260 [Candidatus Dependentiae bacterium]|nr:hypothetical protein [Candidatus Dependentiae bacterium]